MLFNSYFFILVFLPATLACVALARRNRSAELTVLVGASLVFYGWWNLRDLGLLLASAGFNFVLALAMERRARSRTPFLVFGVAANLAQLGYFKYLDLFATTWTSLGGGSWRLEQAALPLAISFFTFQQIANLVDVGRGHPAERNPLRYLFYVAFFPHLIAGPIVYHRDLAPQTQRVRTPDELWFGLSVGLTLFVLGLVQKTLLADHLAPYVNQVYEAAGSGRPLSFVDAWGGAAAFSFQIYFDFGGYSLMAVGLGKMFGYDFPFNFDSPYKARSFIEFWRRWHRSLSEFFRDYLYVPLGGNRGGRLAQARNVLVTMALAGLWHGAAWTFLIWGLLHGVLIVANHLWRKSPLGTRGRRLGETPWGAGLFRLGLFLALTCTWVVFRASDLTTTGAMLKAMFVPDADPFSLRYLEDGMTVLPFLGVLFLFATIMPNCRELLESPRRLALRATPAAAVTLGLLFVACLFHLTKAREFIYFLF